MIVNSIEIQDDYIGVEIEGFDEPIIVFKRYLWAYLMRCPRLIHWTMEEYFSIDFDQIKEDIQNYINEEQ